jgi:hypothetical protein
MSNLSKIIFGSALCSWHSLTESARRAARVVQAARAHLLTPNASADSVLSSSSSVKRGPALPTGAHAPSGAPSGGPAASTAVTQPPPGLSGPPGGPLGELARISMAGPPPTPGGLSRVSMLAPKGPGSAPVLPPNGGTSASGTSASGAPPRRGTKIGMRDYVGPRAVAKKREKYQVSCCACEALEGSICEVVGVVWV